MQARFGPLEAEVAFGESERFTASLLLVHGLWDDASVWRRFAGFLTHRGWRCIAVQMNSRPHAGPDEMLGSLQAAIAVLEAPPVVIGHDLGGLLALRSAGLARAVVALAPLVPAPFGEGSLPALGQAGGWLSRRFASSLRAPRGRWRSAYRPRPGAREPARLLAELRKPMDRIEPVRAGVPALVVAGGADSVSEPDDARRLAERTAAEFRCIDRAGHALPNDVVWQECVSFVHRWLVKRLGVTLLELWEESQDG